MSDKVVAELTIHDLPELAEVDQNRLKAWLKNIARELKSSKENPFRRVYPVPVDRRKHPVEMERRWYIREKEPVTIYRTNETGEWLWVVDVNMSSEFWLNGFRRRESAVRYCQKLGLPYFVEEK